MIKTVADKRMLRFYEGPRVKEFDAFADQAKRRIAYLDAANSIEALMALPSNRFEALGGKRKGQYSIRINMQWRICFRFEKGDAYDVEIVDYH
ncbi:MAG: type II toxin-antitoxin system RelE/ParE family toxin [Alphaproteobacteria bacterium]|nr:type II toxin-antitoxin system RelE/ParE family toxin [Alphaproteobacteria bacterium]